MSTQNRLELTLSPQRITQILITIVLALTLIHSIGQIAHFTLGWTPTTGILPESCTSFI